MLSACVVVRFRQDPLPELPDLPDPLLALPVDSDGEERGDESTNGLDFVASLQAPAIASTSASSSTTPPSSFLVTARARSGQSDPRGVADIVVRMCGVGKISYYQRYSRYEATCEQHGCRLTIGSRPSVSSGSPHGKGRPLVSWFFG